MSRHRTLMNVFDKLPQVHNDAFVAPSASLTGDIEVGQGSSIWYGCVLRGTAFALLISISQNFCFCLTITHSVWGSTLYFIIYYVVSTLLIVPCTFTLKEHQSMFLIFAMNTQYLRPFANNTEWKKQNSM